MTLFYMALAWCAGILLANWSPSTSAAGPWLVIVGCIFWLLFLQGEPPRRRVALCVLAGGLGMVRFAAVQPNFTPADLAFYNDAGYFELTGVVSDAPDVRDASVRLRVSVESLRQRTATDPRWEWGPAQKISGQNVVLAYVDRLGDYAYGDRIRIEGTPQTPPEFDTFNYRDYLARSCDFLGQNCVHAILLRARITYTLRGAAQVNPIRATLIQLKNSSQQMIDRFLPSPESALLSGILLGNDNDIPVDIKAAFNETSTTHLIAISGANFAVIVGLMLALFGRLRRRGLAVFLTLLGIVLYTLFVGASASVVRAALMAALVQVASYAFRRADPLTSLAASVWIFTAINPLSLFDVALHLSVAATLGLILYAKPMSAHVELVLQRLFARETARGIAAVLSDTVLITVAAQITTLPIILMTFGRFSQISLLTNLLVAPAQAWIMILGILAVALGVLFVPLGQIVAWLVGLLLAYTLAVIRNSAQLQGAAASVTLNPGAVISYYMVLFTLTAYFSQIPERRHALRERLGRIITVPLVAGVGAGVAILLWAMVLSRPDGSLHVWFLAVGEGNAVLVQTPNGAHLLVDGGSNPSRLQASLGDRLPFYKREIDLLFVTQPKPVTIQALPPMFERYTVRQIVSNGQAIKDRELAGAFERASKTIPVITAVAGYRAQTSDGVTIQVLHPTKPPDASTGVDDAGLVLRLTYGNASFLLMSDMSKPAVEALMAARMDLRATVVQLPSNGSETANTQEWLNALQPQVALILAEAGDSSAQPAESVLKWLAETPLYRTDKHGTVEIATDGTQLWISTAQRP